MNGKELLLQFKTAPWKSDQEAEAFADSAEPLTGADVVKLLDSLGARPSDTSDARRRRVMAFARLAERHGDKSLFLPMVRALRAADPVLRTALPALLKRFSSIPDHRELVGLLRVADPAVRAAASDVLRELGGRSVFEALAALVEEPAFGGRVEAMDLLVAVASHHAVPPLEAVLRVGSPAEKGHALRLLADSRCHGRDPGRALRAIVSAFDDPSEPVGAQALAAFCGLCHEDDYFAEVARFLDHPSPTLRRTAVEGLSRFTSDRALAAAQAALRRGPNPLRLVAIGVLEAMAVEAVRGPLVDALAYESLVVRTRAGEALQRLSRAGRIDLVRTVVWLLRSRDVNVRRLAAELAQAVPDPDAGLWPKLLDFLRDEDWWVRERVADALVEMAGPGLVRHVVPLLAAPDDLLRRFAVDALLRLRAPEALGALVRTAGADADWWVRERAIEAVAALGDRRAVPHIVDIMVREPELRIACLHALGALGGNTAAPHVAALLSSGDADVARAALQCLSAVGDASHAPAVELLLSHLQPSLRILAREVLVRWDARASASLPRPVSTLSRLDRLLAAMAEAEADDLILAPDRPPVIKRFGHTLPLQEAALSALEVRDVLQPLLTIEQRELLQRGEDVDLSYEVRSEALRFRVNVFNQMGGLSAVFRGIKGSLLELDALGLPAAVQGFVTLNHGLVLVGGPTGAGKSTTLAAIIGRINATSARHVISLEDPIEVVHRRQRSLVNQREIGTHARSFASALRSTLREDPDVILIGEMRDPETIAFALTAAETGHLVFASIHTSSAATTVDRIVNALPPGRQDDARSMLAGSLRAVVCQYLLRRRDGPGRVLASEVLLNNDAVANLIRKNKTFQLPSLITTSREAGMQLMDAELMRLYREGRINAEDAYLKAVSKKDFEALVGEAGRPGGGKG